MTVTFIAHSAYLVEWDKFYTLFDYSRRSKLSGFSFAVMRQIINSFYFELLLCYLMSAIGMNRQECKHK